MKYFEINKNIADSINNKSFTFDGNWLFSIINKNEKYYISKQELDNIQIPDYLFLLDKDSIGRYINIKDSTFNPFDNE